ncbi:TIGR03986 family type III CRISPR-associated RAMP protein [Saccharopolyspora hattusasensis]|uniref:TIGR03986 family type III CRISPR-associated RAMP protein n=1 Tax=Saccharopolyspora hattusasensis TaxID=1128679 RepID=UPI003D9989A1
MGEFFVNPYAFVPLPPEAPQRGAPHGHRGNPALLTGKLAVSIEALTPLLIRGFGSDDSPELPTRPDGTAFIPGSSWKGAIRSLHETMTGSCIRVFDDEFLPSYRDPVEWSKGRLMAVVTAAPQDDRPPEVELCQPGDPSKDRLTAAELHGINAHHPLLSGTRFTRKDGEFRRDPNGEWVLFLSDTRDDDGPYHGHLRKLSGKTAEVPQEIWDRFRKLVQDADDQRPAEKKAQGGKPIKPVTVRRKSKNGTEKVFNVGNRDIASAKLRKHQPVWVKWGPNRGITDLGLAMAWRHPGEHPAGERVREFGPCTSDRELCPSCRLFGSADLSGKPDDPVTADLAMQRSYRGHVRFGDALADAVVKPEPFTLPPLGVPRPGAGQFYLHNDGFEGKTTSGQDQPLREWGSEADQEKPRELRGRKYYWHTTRFNGREKARPHQVARPDQEENKMVSKAVAFPVGTRLTATITFTDIDRAQLGGLLAALLPGRAIQSEGLLQHIGGGRPLGFGSCRITLVEGEMWTNGSRYCSASAKPPVDAEQLLAEFRNAQPESHRKILWPQVVEVLRPDAVDPAKVWYPPGAPWAQRGSEKFDAGFAFWKQTSGYGEYPLSSLPQVDPSAERGYELPLVIEEIPQQKGRS